MCISFDIYRNNYRYIAMSINLYVICDGVSLDLVQTPTYITCMCMMSCDGVKSKLKKKHALRAVNCYLMWASTIANNADHIDYVRSCVDQADEIFVYCV